MKPRRAHFESGAVRKRVALVDLERFCKMNTSIWLQDCESSSEAFAARRDRSGRAS